MSRTTNRPGNGLAPCIPTSYYVKVKVADLDFLWFLFLTFLSAKSLPGCMQSNHIWSSVFCWFRKSDTIIHGKPQGSRILLFSSKAALANCKQGAFRQGGTRQHAAKPNNLFSTVKTDQL